MFLRQEISPGLKVKAANSNSLKFTSAHKPISPLAALGSSNTTTMFEARLSKHENVFSSLFLTSIFSISLMIGVLTIYNSYSKGITGNCRRYAFKILFNFLISNVDILCQFILHLIDKKLSFTKSRESIFI